MASPSPAQPTGPTPLSPTSPPGTPPRASRRVLAIVVAVVVVAAALLAVLASGVLSSSSGTGTSQPLSYSSAETLASSAAAQVSSGPWTLYAVIGADDRQGYTNDSFGVSTGCTVSGGPDVLSIPATSGNYSDGSLSAWIFAYLSASGKAQLAIEVDGGHATEIGVATGSGCGSPASGLSPVPGEPLDSTQVAQSLLGDSEVEAFLHNYTSANASYTLVNPRGGNVGATWQVEYTACGLPVLGAPASSSASGGRVAVWVNATTGALSSVEYLPPATACAGTGTGPSKVPIGSAFAAGNPVSGTCPSGDTYAQQGCRAGDYTYTLTVEASAVNLSSVLFEVELPGGGVCAVMGEGGFSILNVSGRVIAQVSLSMEMEMLGPWTTYSSPVGPGTSLTAVDLIEIDMGTANPMGENLQFVAMGTGGYTGTTSPVALP